MYMYTSAKKEHIDTHPEHFHSKDRLSPPPVRPAWHDIRISTGDNTGITQRMKVYSPTEKKTITISTISELETYYQTLDSSYHIDMSTFLKMDATITEEEVNNAICQIGGPIDLDSDIDNIWQTILKTREEKGDQLRKFYDSTPEPKSSQLSAGKKGAVIGNESGWHIHLVKDNNHLKYGKDKGARIDLHSKGGQSFIPEDIYAAAASLIDYISSDNNAEQCYNWLWRRLYELKSDLIRQLPLPSIGK